MKKKILVILGLMLLSVSILDAAPGQLGNVTGGLKSIKDTLFQIARVVAAIGLLVIGIRYFFDQSGHRTVPWGWVVGAILIGATPTILGWFGL